MSHLKSFNKRRTTCINSSKPVLKPLSKEIQHGLLTPHFFFFFAFTHVFGHFVTPLFFFSFLAFTQQLHLDQAFLVSGLALASKLREASRATDHKGFPLKRSFLMKASQLSKVHRKTCHPQGRKSTGTKGKPDKSSDLSKRHTRRPPTQNTQKENRQRGKKMVPAQKG